MELDFVVSVGHFFSIHALLLCLQEEIDASWNNGDQVTTFPWQIGIFNQTLGVRELSQRVLVACDEVDLSQVDRRDFGENTIWLVSSKMDVKEIKNLPLTLNSNLLMYYYKGENGRKDTLLISEVYSIKDEILVTNVFGHWSTSEGLTVPEPMIWERRRNLQGAKLVNMVMHWNPITILERDNNTHTGFFGELLSELQEALNFRYGNET